MKAVKLLLLFLAVCPGAHAQQVKFYRTYGEGVYNSGQAVLQTADSGYVIAGGINTFDADGLNMMLLRTDSLGVQQWRKSIGGPGIDFAKHFTYSPGRNGWTMAGYTSRSGNYDVLVAATDLNGDTLWTHTYGGADWDMAYCIDTTYDGGYIIAGETFSFGAGNSDAWIMKLSATGDTLWTRTFGGTDEDNARWVFEDRDSNLLVVGSTQSFGAGKSDVYVLYLDETGDTIWTRTVGTAENEWGYSGDMYFDMSNTMSFMIGGNIEVSSPHFITFFNPRVNIAGSVLYIREGDLSDSYTRDKTRIRNENAGGFFYYSTWYKKPFYSQYNLELQRTYYGANFGYVVAELGSMVYDERNNDVMKTVDLGYVLTGEVDEAGPNITACYLLKTDSMGTNIATPLVGYEDPEIFSGITVFPNPVHDHLQISGLDMHTDGELMLYDITGRLYKTQAWASGNTLQWVDMSGVAPGIYYLRLRSGPFFTGRRIIRY